MPEDYHLFLTFSDRGHTFYRQPEILADYRIHASQTSSTEFIIFMLSVRAYRLVEFKNIPQKQTRLAIKKRLNRYLLHNIDMLSAEEKRELLKFYAEFPGLKMNALMHSCMLWMGIPIYKKWAYRCIDLTPLVKE